MVTLLSWWAAAPAITVMVVTKSFVSCATLIVVGSKWKIWKQHNEREHLIKPMLIRAETTLIQHSSDSSAVRVCWDRRRRNECWISYFWQTETRLVNKLIQAWEGKNYLWETGEYLRHLISNNNWQTGSVPSQLITSAVIWPPSLPVLG